MPIEIGDVQFPHNVFCAVGARGFFGEGYWLHRYFKLMGLTWSGTNFCAKTTTYFARVGNMPLAHDGISPAEKFPRCITANRSGHVLNAVGLSGLGARNLLRKDLWQSINEPFSLSFMAVGKTEEQRRKEYELFAFLLKCSLPKFKSSFILQLNFGCPNAGLSLEELRNETVQALKIMSEIGVPLVPNFNPLVPAELIKELQDTGLCAGFWIANSIPYDFQGLDDFQGLGKSIFGQEVSPLTQKGFPSAGGISGPRCLPYTIRTVEEARNIGVILPIIAGNGIRTSRDVHSLKKAGANAIAIGSIGMVPPYMLLMRSVIGAANATMGD